MSLLHSKNKIKHPPNHVAASDALRLNCDSKNFGPKVDMPAMRVASVAPAKHRHTNVGFFRRSSIDLQKEIKGRNGSVVNIKFWRNCKGQKLDNFFSFYVTLTE